MRARTGHGQTIARAFSTHEQQMKVLQNQNEFVVYPKDSNIINSRLFYQHHVHDWAAKQQRTVSLRQLAFFGRNLTRDKLIMSANFVREELPIRLAHRIQNMEMMPYKIMSNSRLTNIFERYVQGFDAMRRVKEITDMDGNAEYCTFLANLLDSHNDIVSDLLLGVMESVLNGTVTDPVILDRFVRGMLMSRVSRRVLAEQHISLSNAYANGITNSTKDQTYVGEVFLQCTARDIIDEAKSTVARVIGDQEMPDIQVEGDLDTIFPYIRNHVEFIVCEVLRNSVEACLRNGTKVPISLSVSSTGDNVFVRISDQGGGIATDALDTLWTFVKPYNAEKFTPEALERLWPVQEPHHAKRAPMGPGLSQLTMRKSGKGTGIGLPLARVYAEYWGGALEVHSLEGFGCDSLIRISRLGTMLENLRLDRV